MSARLRNIDLNLLKVFDAIMREQSISRAATRLYLSQPAVSNSLKRLRALYEDELFIRTAKGVIPSPRAREIAESVQNALRDVESTLQAESKFRPSNAHRKFTISITDYGEQHFLPHIMRDLTAEAPGLDVTCWPALGATLTLEMKSGVVDLVWDWQRIDDPDYCTEVIFSDRSCLVACRDHPLLKDQPVSLDAFLELEHVALRSTRTHIPMIERKLEKLGVERKVVCEVSHILTIPGIVAQTNLVACMPERLARSYSRQLPLQYWPNPVFKEPVPVYQMWHRHLEEDPGHRWFRALLMSIAAEI